MSCTRTSRTSPSFKNESECLDAQADDPDATAVTAGGVDADENEALRKRVMQLEKEVAWLKETLCICSAQCRFFSSEYLRLTS